jgi:predicted small secreted protein
MKAALALLLCAVLLAACGRTVVRAEGSGEEVEDWSVGIEF